MPLKKTLADLAADLRERGVPELDLEEFNELRAERDDLLVIDVREDHEWARGYIPGSVHISRGIIERDIEKKAFGGMATDADLDRPIVCYCGGGTRSLFATAHLIEMGFTDVQSLEGGFRGWTNNRGEVAIDR